MNGGAPGLAGAPVTKGLLLATGLASALARATGAGAGAGATSPLARALVFRTPAELAVGAALLYHGRLLERRTGSSAYGAAAALATAAGGAAAALLRSVLRLPPVSGPYALLFANVVPYALDVPSLTSLAGGAASDKALVYAAAVQLAACGGRGALAAAVGGLLAGAAVRGDVGGLASLRFPPAVTSLLARLLGPIVGRPVVECTVVPPDAGAAAGSTGGAPPPPPAWAAVAAEPPADAVRQLVAMGFDERDARAALRRRGGDVAAALGELLPAT